MLAHDAQLKILNDMVTPQKKKRTRPKKQPPIDRLSMWEWDTLVAAWRWYEYGATATSACFPRDIIERFWCEGNRYTDNVRHLIAYQFAMTDHGSKGEKDWTGKQGFKMECDLRPWTTFYRFCEAWVKGFTPITVKDPDTKKKMAIMAFHVDYTGKWIGRDQYIEHGDNGYINPDCILHIPERVK